MRPRVGFAARTGLAVGLVALAFLFRSPTLAASFGAAGGTLLGLLFVELRGRP